MPRPPPLSQWAAPTVLLLMGGASLWSLSRWSWTPYGLYLVLAGNESAWLARAVHLIDWGLMCVAMMLPTALPLVRSVQRLLAGRPQRLAAVLACCSAFLAAWLLVGVAVRGVQEVLVWATTARGWSTALRQVALPLSIAAAGAFMWTPLAKRCATACRSPFGFVARHWTGAGHPVAQVTAMGWDYGWSCIGCCWPLMTVMCLLGLSNPAWMLAMALVMWAQKSNRHGVQLGRLIGLALVVFAVALASGLLSVQQVRNSLGEPASLCLSWGN